MRTVEEFKIAAKEKNITRWDIHACGFCQYMCGYEIVGDLVFYDSGCDCTRLGGPQARSWQDLVEHYNMQKSPEYIKEMDEFWGFK